MYVLSSKTKSKSLQQNLQVYLAFQRTFALRITKIERKKYWIFSPFVTFPLKLNLIQIRKIEVK